MHDQAPILLVDDRPANLTVLEAILDRPDYALIRADSGRAALDAVAHHGELAVILLDLAMPIMDGFETADRIRALDEARTPPIIFVTANPSDKEHVYKAYRAGAVDYLEKPLEPDVVRAKVAVFVSLFRQRRALARHAEVVRELEAKRARLEAAEAAIAMRDEFIAIASHELRTPLTPLQLEIQALGRAFRRGDRPSQEYLRGRLDTVERQVGKLNALIDSLLDVSRIVHGQLSVDRQRVDLGRLVEDTCERFRNQALSNGVDLHTTTPQHVYGRCDRLRIEEVVSNLLSNALKYGSGKPVHVTLTASATHALLVVRDYGIGIAPERAPHIFERFERAVSSRHYGGLGLGLYIARKIVEAHEGTIAVESALGEGATFTVSLPLR